MQKDMPAIEGDVTGVVGYVPVNSIRRLKGKSGTVDLKFERGNDKVLMRVKREDIVEVKVGRRQGDEARAQVILKPGSVVETVIKALRDVKAIDDPTLTRLTASALVSVSFV